MKDDVYKILGASNHSDSIRSKNDFYATPPLAVEQLLEVETFDKNVWEPATGMNHITDVLEEHGYNVRRSDIVDMVGDPKLEIIDMLNSDEKFDGDIVTNPPYGKSLEFLKKCIDAVPEGNKVAMFLKIQFLETKKRADYFQENPPKVIYVAARRFGCSPTGEFNEDGNCGSAVCYAWFVWEKGFKGNPIIKWINR